MSIWEKIKRKINGSLEKLAKENEKAYGSAKLDCCDLNKDNNGRRK